MTFEPYRDRYASARDDIRTSGLWKEEHRIATAQRPRLELANPASGASRPMAVTVRSSQVRPAGNGDPGPGC